MSMFSDSEPYELRELREENARLRSERAIIDRELRKSNLDATRWFIVEALAMEASREEE